MARPRSKKYAHGDKVMVSLGRGVSQEFIDWMNEQTDLSAFFLYGAAKLHEDFGRINVADVAPRRINIDVSKDERDLVQSKTENEELLLEAEENKNSTEVVEIASEEEKKKPTQWAGIDEIDDDGFV